ncbi:hypothetical protein AUR64_07455 [Haloprofundus marisrubri]|uniref:Uncharacterized protein n=1 Tax=Haloprofundus marisrubri TaxID=1514971 RepID=A0A0W1RBZ8_9EURY|nr:hypothetical protein [Haloprofundus marisrubri]KTG10994.1 hypothetical protein AUR64_07455 [Haloprofundus marisrubri]
MTRENQTRRRFLAGSAATLSSLSLLAGGASAQASTQTFAVVNATGDGPAKYRFSVDGDVEKTTDSGGAPRAFASLNGDDTVDGATAEGRVYGGADAYQFTGSVTNLVVEGGAAVYVDGDEVDPSDYPTSGVLTITGNGEYTFAVDGTVEKTTLTGGADVPPASLNAADSVDGGSVSGSVFGGTDAYVVDGAVTEFDLGSGLTGYLDGSAYAGPSDGRGDTGGTDEDNGGDSDSGESDDTQEAPELAFPDCTSVQITGAFESASLELLVEDDDPATTPMEQVYEYDNADGATTATISVPDGEFGPYQVVEAASVTYGDGQTTRATNPDAGACRDETFPSPAPTVEFVDCTTVDVSGAFESASMDVLVEDDSPETTPMEQVYTVESGGSAETTISVPDGEFGPYQVVEAVSLTYGDGETLDAVNPDADACREETFPALRNVEFVDCTTVQVTGAFEEVVVEVLVQDDVPPTTPMEEVYTVAGDGSEETTVTVPADEFGPYQVAERATVVYPDGEQLDVTNTNADSCRSETFPN